MQLDVQLRDDIGSSLSRALTAPGIPPEILQVLLNLCEFMERHGRQLSIETHVLGGTSSENSRLKARQLICACVSYLLSSGIAEKCAAWAKALHYKEIEFQKDPGATCEALISINHQLDLPEAAAGILHYAQNVYHIELKESWYEKLQRWETALQIYEAKQVHR